MVSLGHPSKFQQVSRLGSVTAQHSRSGRQQNCGAKQRVPSIFGRAAITLGIGPHSSCKLFNWPIEEYIPGRECLSRHYFMNRYKLTIVDCLILNALLLVSCLSDTTARQLSGVFQ